MVDREAALAAVRTLLLWLGEDPTRAGLRETPRRVVDALAEMNAGAQLDPTRHLKTTFETTSQDEVVVLRKIAFTSLCEHHLLPFEGVAHIGYVPAQSTAQTTTYRVVGLSKMARVVREYAQRLQLQEQLTAQIATALEDALGARGVAVVVEASHTCMSCRGVRVSGATMRTSAMLGVFRESHAARAEVLTLLLGP